MSKMNAVVIGASSGIGRESVLGLAALGWNVTAIARRGKLLDELSALYTNVTTRVADVENTDLLGEIIHDSGPIDAMIYAAGYNIPERELSVLDPANWHKLQRINVDGAFYATTAALEQMRTRGGVIVYISSISAYQADVSGAAYQSSKRGLHGLAAAVNIEESKNGVRASLVAPGLTKTDFNSLRRNPPSEEQRAQFLTPYDVAQAVIFICTLPAHVMIPELTILPTAIPGNR
jgi:NADP-dependent 3-hydroxy acid dehydrogenase YdfG